MSEMCPAEKRSRIADYLRARAADGKKYFKAKNIASEIGLSSREVGSNLKKLSNSEESHLDIKKRARSRAHTWEVDLPTAESAVMAAPSDD